MDRFTGKPLERDKHIPQSIDDILSTPKGTRIMRRDYGATYLNQDGSARTGLQGDDVAEEATALLAEYEPRIRVYGVSATMIGGTPSSITVEYADNEDTTGRTLRHVTAF
ncbi:GPW/gp25 family protein [Sphingomonas sp. NIBR02145]|uniref:GPW/gp25 family protein n=1 Tax=Sphingomonas sp. NIBR02145 TaxID=3014784 RepID=UPI0022B57CAA|nr:GPW/gp25 family protein [Sphingomonas sp. NIBR02145]WHU03666.1 GPW/gp25 family protein [Sphingomonas sp. NIBR02145]